MITLNVRIPDELVIAIERELEKLKEELPGVKLGKSDIVRHALKLYFDNKEEK